MSKLIERLSDKYSLEYKNGYFITHEHAVKTSGKCKGDEYVRKTKTYATPSQAYQRLKEVGEDGSEVTTAVARLVKQHSANVYQEYLKDKAKKEKEGKNE